MSRIIQSLAMSGTIALLAGCATVGVPEIGPDHPANPSARSAAGSVSPSPLAKYRNQQDAPKGMESRAAPDERANESKVEQPTTRGDSHGKH